jgi:hypothetical protein
MSTTYDYADLAQKGQEQFLEAVRANQQAIVDAVSAWSQTMQAYAPAAPPVPDLDQLPKPEQIIDETFDLVEKLVSGQRRFARDLVKAAAPARPAARRATPTPKSAPSAAGAQK